MKFVCCFKFTRISGIELYGSMSLHDLLISSSCLKADDKISFYSASFTSKQQNDFSCLVQQRLSDSFRLL